MTGQKAHADANNIPFVYSIAPRSKVIANDDLIALKHAGPVGFIRHERHKRFILIWNLTSAR